MKQGGARAGSILDVTRLVVLNASFWTLASMVTLIFLLVGIPYVTAFGLLFRNRRRTLYVFRRTISYYGAAIIRCGWPLIRVRFVDHAPKDAPPFIFIANHRSSSDPFLMACLPFECIQVLNNWPARIPVLGVVSLLAGYLKIREMPFDEFVAAGSKLLAQGTSVITFPEGTRSRSGKLGSFHGSAFRLAQHQGATVVPLAISGNANSPRRGSLVLHPGRIVVTKLPAIRAEQHASMSPYKFKMWVRDIIQRQVDGQSA